MGQVMYGINHSQGFAVMFMQG